MNGALQWGKKLSQVRWRILSCSEDPVPRLSQIEGWESGDEEESCKATDDGNLR